MKVLWFSLSPCGSLRRNNMKRIIQGWMVSLEDEVKKHQDIKLSVAYPSEVQEPPFEFDGVTYYPIYSPRVTLSKFEKLFDVSINFSNHYNRLIPVMENIIAKVSPDIIHMHGTEEFMGLVSKYVPNIPIVYSIQGLLAPYEKKFYSGLSHEDIIKEEQTLKNRITHRSIDKEFKYTQYRSQREISYLTEAKYIFGRTFWDKSITKLLNPSRLYFVVNEILRTDFYTKEWDKVRFEDTLQIVSTLSPGPPYKGFETLLSAAAYLQQYAKCRFEWHVIGYDDSTRWVKLSEKKLNLKSSNCNIVFHGRLDSCQMLDVLIRSDIYCHVSHIENSPNSVCEAMLLGMPIIASSVGGTSSLLENEKEGLLIQDGDPYVLAGCILGMQENFANAKEMAFKARIRAKKRHNAEAIYNELLSGYKSILQIENNKK